VVVFWFHVLYVFGLAAYPTLRMSVLERRSACSPLHIHVYTRSSVCTAVVLTTEVTVTHLLRVAKMPFVFSHVEYCDIHFVYGFCNGNALAAVEEYRRRFPDRRIPSRRVFTRIHQTLCDTGCLPSVAVRSERDVVGTINTRENILEMVQRSPRLSTCRMASRIRVSPSRQHCFCHSVPVDMC